FSVHMVDASYYHRPRNGFWDSQVPCHRPRRDTPASLCKIFESVGRWHIPANPFGGIYIVSCCKIALNLLDRLFRCELCTLRSGQGISFMRGCVRFRSLCTRRGSGRFTCDTGKIATQLISRGACRAKRSVPIFFSFSLRLCRGRCGIACRISPTLDGFSGSDSVCRVLRLLRPRPYLLRSANSIRCVRSILRVSCRARFVLSRPVCMSSRLGYAISDSRYCVTSGFHRVYCFGCRCSRSEEHT